MEIDVKTSVRKNYMQGKKAYQKFGKTECSKGY